MLFKLDNKTAIVTGGGSGIGRAIAKLFAKQGAAVFIFDLDKLGSIDTMNEILSERGVAHFIQCDVSDQQNVKVAVEQVKTISSGIHILINNAGVAHVGNAENTSEEDFTRLFNINVKGVYNCLHEIIPVMKKILS